MISKMDVITMFVPIPNINSGLALNSHMYICLNNGLNKEFIKCQTFKPTHLLEHTYPRNYLIEESDSQHNPFKNNTTIDCDKSFCVSNVTVNLRLLTPNRKDVSAGLFSRVINKIVHPSFNKITLDIPLLVGINLLISHP